MSKFRELRPATTEDCNARWNCDAPGKQFRCGFCGREFAVGDLWRGLYTNSTPGAGGNPLVCEHCNAEDKILIERWKRKHQLWKEICDGELWWFVRNMGRQEVV